MPICWTNDLSTGNIQTENCAMIRHGSKKISLVFIALQHSVIIPRLAIRGMEGKHHEILFTQRNRHGGVAKADELAALRASQAALAAQQAALDRQQDLLNARINQLAQAAGPNPGGGVGPLGTPEVKGVQGAGSFARSFLIPGTETSIRVGGFIDESVFYYLQNGPANGVPSVTAEIDGNLETQPIFSGG